MAEEQKIKKVRKLKGKSIVLLIVLAIIAAGALVQFGKGIKANKDKAKLEAAEKVSKHDNEVSVQEDK